MTPNLLFYQLLLVALVLIGLLIHIWWPDDPRITTQTLRKPDQPRHKRFRDPKPFTGYVHKPLCAACETGTYACPCAPGSPPPIMTFSRGRRRMVDTHSHFCPDPDCSYHGWLGRGNIRAGGVAELDLRIYMPSIYSYIQTITSISGTLPVHATWHPLPPVGHACKQDITEREEGFAPKSRTRGAAGHTAASPPRSSSQSMRPQSQSRRAARYHGQRAAPTQTVCGDLG
jgi:hypothetical protein